MSAFMIASKPGLIIPTGQPPPLLADIKTSGLSAINYDAKRDENHDDTATLAHIEAAAPGEEKWNTKK